MNSSPQPWHAVGTDFMGCPTIRDAKGFQIATFLPTDKDDQDLDNRDFVGKAVAAYQPMRDALVMMLDAIEYARSEADAINNARTVLALYKLEK